MRTTVGPLSPAVYWRRRALVIGVVAVVVLLVAYSCSGSEEDGRQGATGNRPSASTDPSGRTQGPPGPPAVVPSAGEATGGPPVAGGNNGGTPGGSPRPGAGGDGGSLCSDAEMDVIAIADPVSVRQGAHATLTLKVKNVSGRACSRDIGADMQEIWIAEGDTKQWSSDLCENRSGEGMTAFPSGHELAFPLDWNGRITAQGCDNRPYLSPGTYQVYARVGTKKSNPATLIVTA